MKEVIKNESKTFAIIGIAASIIALSSLFTTVMVQFTQIFMYMFILLMIPGFIALKTIEAKANIAQKSMLLANNRVRYGGKKYDKKVVQSSPTEVVDYKTNNKSTKKRRYK